MGHPYRSFSGVRAMSAQSISETETTAWPFIHRSVWKARSPNFASKLSEKSCRCPKRGLTGNRSGTVRPVLASIQRPNSRSERSSNPFSDSFLRLDFSHLGRTAIDTLLSPLHRKLRSRCLPPADYGDRVLSSLHASSLETRHQHHPVYPGDFCGLRWEADPKKVLRASVA